MIWEFVWYWRRGIQRWVIKSSIPWIVCESLAWRFFSTSCQPSMKCLYQIVPVSRMATKTQTSSSFRFLQDSEWFSTDTMYWPDSFRFWFGGWKELLGLRINALLATRESMEKINPRWGGVSVWYLSPYKMQYKINFQLLWNCIYVLVLLICNKTFFSFPACSEAPAATPPVAIVKYICILYNWTS